MQSFHPCGLKGVPSSWYIDWYVHKLGSSLSLIFQSFYWGFTRWTWVIKSLVTCLNWIFSPPSLHGGWQGGSAESSNPVIMSLVFLAWLAPPWKLCRAPPWITLLAETQVWWEGACKELKQTLLSGKFQEFLKLCARKQGQRLDICFIISHHLRHICQIEFRWLPPTSC